MPINDPYEQLQQQAQETSRCVEAADQRKKRCFDTSPFRRPPRPSWDEYFMLIAKAVATRADCSRRKVGAVVVRDNRIVATGYNGSPPGDASCLAGQCPRARSGVLPGSSYDTGPGSCIAIHAEANALLYAGLDGSKGSTLYVTEVPCQGCTKLIHAMQLSRVWTPNGDSW